MNYKNSYIVLAQPYTADNIGAAARSMKNMGFTQLRLVAPRRNWKVRARVLACHAKDVLENVEVFKTLKEAVEDLHWTVGTTSRLSQYRGKFVSFDQCIQVAQQKSAKLKIGIVFGSESKGLSSREVSCCDQLVSLPADEGYPSINLAQSVMIMVFSMAQKNLNKTSQMGSFVESTNTLVNKAATQSALKLMEEALKSIGFYRGKKGRLDPIMKIAEGFFKRAGMHSYESQSIKGVSARIIQRMTKKK